MRYDPAAPAFHLKNRWACCPIAVKWALASLGVGLQEDYLELSLEEAGLLEAVDGAGMVDKTGLELAGYLSETLAVFSVLAHHEVDVDFESILHRAGSWPMVAYGGGWGHWTGIRGSDRSLGVLTLANSADPLQHWPRQTLSRSEWVDLGPFNVVEIRRK